MNDMRQASLDVAVTGAAVLADTIGDATARVENGDRTSDVIPVVEETLTVSKRSVVTGKVRVSTRTEVYQDVAEVTLDRNVVDVERVPVGRIIEVAPSVRTEGDTTIVPVIEERFIVVKQLFLKEELRIRHRVEHELSRTPIQLRRQTAVIERLDAHGKIVVDDPTSSS